MLAEMMSHFVIKTNFCGIDLSTLIRLGPSFARTIPPVGLFRPSDVTTSFVIIVLD